MVLIAYHIIANFLAAETMRRLRRASKADAKKVRRHKDLSRLTQLPPELVYEVCEHALLCLAKLIRLLDIRVSAPSGPYPPLCYFSLAEKSPSRGRHSSYLEDIHSQTGRTVQDTCVPAQRQLL